jgi:formylglycine-generating enzyme required for sulfatase activity
MRSEDLSRQEFEPEMVAVPAGPFLMGDPHGDVLRPEIAADQFTCDLNYDYTIARYPSTVGQFRYFIEAGGYREKKYWTEMGWQWRERKACTQPGYWTDEQWTGDDRLPVVGVSWYEAYAYSCWLAEAAGRDYGLPTEAEWEKATRGGLKLADGSYNPLPDRAWPWGDEKPGNRYCNCNEEVGHTTPVGSYPAGASPYGVLDMAGNVSEWCLSKWRTHCASQPEDNKPAGNIPRVIRGGSWGEDPVFTGCSSRDWELCGWRSRGCGFRVVRSFL